MQPGKSVTFVDADGRHKATVAEITGTGDNLYKRVTLIYGDEQVSEDVPHEFDTRDDDGKATPPYWRERGEARDEVQAPMAEAPPGPPVPSGEAVGSLEPLALPKSDRAKK